MNCYEFRIDYKNGGAIGSHGEFEYCLDEILHWINRKGMKDQIVTKITIFPHDDCWRNK